MIEIVKDLTPYRNKCVLMLVVLMSVVKRPLQVLLGGKPHMAPKSFLPLLPERKCTIL